MKAAVIMEAVRLIVFALSSLCVSILIRWLIKFAWKCKNLPAGPWGVPLLGYIPFLGSQPHRTLFRLSNKYGKVFSVTLGHDTAVVLNDWESIKASLVDQHRVFNGRPHLFLFKALAKQRDIAFTDGPVWKNQHRLTVQILKNLGAGKTQMEGRTMDMVQEVLDTLNQADGQLQPMELVFYLPIVKIIWRLIAGDDIDSCAVSLDEFEKALTLTTKLLQSNGRQMFNTFPWLRFLPPNGMGHWEFVRANDHLLSLLNKVLDQHLSNFNEANLNGFIDHYISEINKRKTDELPYTTESLLYTTWTLSAAGVETTSCTCLWGVLFLAYHPEVQKKAQAELDTVVGRHRLPNLNDVSQLPYIEALIMEIHRKSSMVALSLPHRATETTQVLGHTIPKDTTVIQNIYAVHHDPELWDEPESFRPERFIDEHNKAKAPPYLMPFSLGSRVCIGQQLAEIELRLIFYCVIHQFTFSLPPDAPPPSLIPDVSLNLTPLPFSLLVHKRKDN